MPKTRTTRPSPPRRLPALTMSRQNAAARIEAQISKATQVRAHLQASDCATAERGYEAWHRYNVEMLVRMFANSSVADGYSSCGPPPVIFLGADTASLMRGEPRAQASGQRKDRNLIELVDAKVNRLRQLREQLELHNEPASRAAAPPATPALSALTEGRARRAAFIVHGHEEGPCEVAAHVLRQLDVEPIILHERPDEGRTILEGIETNADVPFAVVLLTPDDVGGKSAAQLKPRAQQNIVLEMGFFWGKLTRSRLCVLYKAGVELPSNLDGLVCVPMDEGGAWRFRLAEELDAAGVEIDFNRLRRR